MAYERTIETDKFKLRITQWHTNPDDWRISIDVGSMSAYFVVDTAYIESFFDALKNGGVLDYHYYSLRFVLIENESRETLIRIRDEKETAYIRLTAEQIAELIP